MGKKNYILKKKVGKIGKKKNIMFIKKKLGRKKNIVVKKSWAELKNKQTLCK